MTKPSHDFVHMVAIAQPPFVRCSAQRFYEAFQLTDDPAKVTCPECVQWLAFDVHSMLSMRKR